MWALSIGGGGAKALWAMPRSLRPAIFKKGLLINIYNICELVLNRNVEMEENCFSITNFRAINYQ